MNKEVEATNELLAVDPAAPLCWECDAQCTDAVDSSCEAKGDPCGDHCALRYPAACRAWKEACSRCGRHCEACRRELGDPDARDAWVAETAAWYIAITEGSGDPEFVVRVKAQTREDELTQLVGDLDRMLLRCGQGVGNKEARDHIARWVERPHGLAALLNGVILPSARRWSASDTSQFSRYVRADVAGNSEWATLEAEQQQLLLDAAYIIVSPLSRIAEAALDVPPPVVTAVIEDRSYLVENLIVERALASIVGPPGAFKSTLLFELLCAVADPAAGSFGGKAVAHGTAAIFCSEDTDSRARQLARHPGAQPNLHIFGGVPDLSSPSKALAFVQRCLDRVMSTGAPKLKVIAIDLFRDTHRGEENSSTDVAPAMATARLLSNTFNCAVIVVHHSALADPLRARGSNSFIGAVDLGLATEPNGDGEVALHVTKNRSGAAGVAFARWHMRDGVLVDGPAPRAASSVGEEAAHAVASVVIELASPTSPLSRGDLTAALAVEYPELFGESVSADTVKQRRRRAVTNAIRSGWIEERAGRFLPGPTPIPEFASVEELIGGGAP